MHILIHILILLLICDAATRRCYLYSVNIQLTEYVIPPSLKSPQCVLVLASVTVSTRVLVFICVVFGFLVLDIFVDVDIE